MRSAVAIVALFITAPLFAATRTWTGNTDGNWMTATNWGGTAPVPADDLVFPAAALNQNNTNNFPADTLFHSLTLSGGAYTLNGNSIILGAGGIATTGGTSVHKILLPITLAVPQSWTLGSGSVATNLAATNLNGMALTIGGSGSAPSFWSGPISGAGSITLNGTAGVDLTGTNTTLAPFHVVDSFLEVVAGTYTGPITADNGAVIVGAGATTGAVTVNGAFSLFVGGVGSPNGVANTGNLTLSGVVQFGELINGTTDFNQTSVTGTVSLGNAFLFLLQVANVPPGTTFTIINNDGADLVNGKFLGLPQGGNVTSLPQSMSAQPQNFTINYFGGTGNDVVLTAQAIATTPTTTTVTTSLNPSQQSQPVTFTATVKPNSGTAVPTGSVTFISFDSTTFSIVELATVPLNSSGVATLTTSTLPIGNFGIVALYSGGGVFGDSSNGVGQVVTASIPALDGRALALLAIALAAFGVLFIKR